MFTKLEICTMLSCYHSPYTFVHLTVVIILCSFFTLCAVPVVNGYSKLPPPRRAPRVRGNGRMMTGCHVSSDRTRDVWGARVGRAWDYGCACVSLFGVHTASGVCCVELWMLRHGCARRSERRPEVSERHAQRGPDIYSVVTPISAVCFDYDSTSSQSRAAGLR